MLSSGSVLGLSDRPVKSLPLFDIVNIHPLRMESAMTAPTAPAPVAPTDMKLPELTRAIKDKVAQITSSLRTSVACAIETGALLIAAKKKVGHGNFERWVANNCELSPATARRWMELADKRPELEKHNSQPKRSIRAI